MKSMTLMTTPAAMPPIRTFFVLMAIRFSLRKGECDSACVGHSVDHNANGVKSARRTGANKRLLLSDDQPLVKARGLEPGRPEPLAGRFQLQFPAVVSIRLSIARGATRDPGCQVRQRRAAEKVPQNLIRLVPA